MPPGTRLLAKAEHLNPSGSGKARLARALLDEAEKEGLDPGDAVVEATSGNTGIALAQVCAIRGYDLYVVTSEKTSEDKIRIMQALGTNIHRAPVVPHDHPKHYTNVAPRLAEEIGAVHLDQFSSRANLRVHREETGPELVSQLRQRELEPDAFVCGVGTGGTLAGVGTVLRKAFPDARVVLADPEGSVLSGDDPAEPFLVEGIGHDEEPPLFEPYLLDETVSVPDEESFRFALLAARHEGLLVGGSSGTYMAAAAHIAGELGEDAVVTTMLPDTGRNYLSTFLDPRWRVEQGLVAPS